MEQAGQVVEAQGDIGVVGSEHPLKDGQGALAERPSGGQLALVLEYYRQVAQAGSSVRIVGPQHPLVNCQGALQERPGEGKLAPRPEVARDSSQQPARGQGRHLSIAHPPEHHLRVREQAGAAQPPFGVRGVGGKGSFKQVDGCDQPPLAHISR